MKSYIILNDIQIPFHDKRVLDLVLDFIDDFKPHGVVLNGDIVDCYDLSEFSHDPIKGYQLKQELRISKWLMERLRKVPEKWWLGGNHEDRLRRYIWRKAPELAVPQLAFENLFELEKYGFKWKPYGEILELGKLLVTHGDIVRKHSAYSAKANFEKEGKSVLTGHTHRLGDHYVTNANGTHRAIENGCLCRLDPEYVHRPNWQQGFAVVFVDPRTGFFNAQTVPILQRRWFYFGDALWHI